MNSEFIEAAKSHERAACYFRSLDDLLKKHKGHDNAKELATHAAIVSTARSRKEIEAIKEVAGCFEERHPMGFLNDFVRLQEDVKNVLNKHGIPTNPNELPK